MSFAKELSSAIWATPVSFVKKLRVNTRRPDGDMLGTYSAKNPGTVW